MGSGCGPSSLIKNPIDMWIDDVSSLVCIEAMAIEELNEELSENK